MMDRQVVVTPSESTLTRSKLVQELFMPKD